MTGVWVTAGLVVATVIGVLIVAALIDRHHESAWRREAGQAAPERGRHRAPKAATIPRAPTEHAPPWDGEKVIEPAAIMAAPVPDPGPEAIIIAAGTFSDGQLTAIAAAVLAPPPVWDEVPALLPAPVAALLGHDSVDDALESMFTRAMARQVRALTDGAS